MPCFFAAPRTSRPLEKTGAELVQDGILFLPQHTAGRLIDRNDVALLVKKKNPFFEVVKKLAQSWQVNHRRSFLC